MPAMISGRFSTSATNRSTPAAMISGKFSVIALTIPAMISGRTVTIASIISGRFSTRAEKSCIPASMISGMHSSKPETTFSMICGSRSTITGIASIRPSAKPVMIESAASTNPASVSGSVSVSTIWSTTSTMVGISSGRLSPMPLASVVMISSAASTSFGRFSTMPWTSEPSSCVPASINSGSFSMTIDKPSDMILPSSLIAPDKPSDLKASFNLVSDSVPNCVNSRSDGVSSSETAIWTPSNADWSRVISPERLSSCTSAICCAEPAAVSMYPDSSSNRFPTPSTSCDAAESMALTLFKSTLLKMVLSACVCSPCVMPDRTSLKSVKMSFSGRKFPSASNALTPRSFISFDALSVGALKERIMLRSAVPPSAPLIPLSARMPRAVFSSLVPPERFFAVPPTVRIALPSWAMDVLLLLDAIAIMSINSALPSMERPKADCASVTMSDAEARSMLPAAARLRIPGRAAMDSSAV